ncbi:MAG: pyridoxamine 5'-phosphate oxidase family protein [candidate division Zixibacteria bacterium]|jgi:nitroimidazol reductase NimA-like FMN-containing flavoprotein (pyridoxamine 5'-phosphate oxidase superfamily)|nr:pyridoxamine 5'-phosphate oxidase family protein [candidate division Zixibacteria bacterium]
MAPDYPPIRRQDRAKEDTWVVQHITEAPYLALALIRDGRPHINTNTFVYLSEPHAIYFHTAPNGTLRTIVESTPDCPVSATAAAMGRLLPAEEAREFSVEFSSVVLFGTISIVDDMAERRRGMEALNRKYFPHLEPGRHYRPVTDKELSQITVYRISIEHWTGKQKAVAADFPGAFLYGSPPTD